MVRLVWPWLCGFMSLFTPLSTGSQHGTGSGVLCCLELHRSV
uniref:Uncharacterized protein n=1 Tax=Arundo donax TaxID=35708 RepID=A0A0A9C8A0_ARUDO